MAAVVCVVVAVVVMLGLALGVHVHVAADDPDGGADRGSLLVTRHATPAGLAVGDTISFTPPAPYDDMGVVTREVAAVGDGGLVTRSPVSEVVDPWRMTSISSGVEEVVARVPWVGYLFITPLATAATLAVALAAGGALLVRHRRRGSVAIQAVPTVPVLIKP